MKDKGPQGTAMIDRLAQLTQDRGAMENYRRERNKRSNATYPVCLHHTSESAGSQTNHTPIFCCSGTSPKVDKLQLFETTRAEINNENDASSRNLFVLMCVSSCIQRLRFTPPW